MNRRRVLFFSLACLAVALICIQLPNYFSRSAKEVRLMNLMKENQQKMKENDRKLDELPLDDSHLHERELLVAEAQGLIVAQKMCLQAIQPESEPRREKTATCYRLSFGAGTIGIISLLLLFLTGKSAVPKAP